MKLASTRRGLLSTATLAMSPFTSADAQTVQSWPVRPVRILVPGPPGGVLDTITRSFTEPLRTRLGQPFVIENRPGGNMVIALEACARATPDGYTICSVTGETLSIYPHIEPALYARYSTLTPVTQMVTSTGVLLVHPSIPANTLPEFAAYAQGRPELNYGSFGEGSAAHLLWEWIKARDGLTIAHIPFRGSADAMTELLAGRVQAFYVALGFALPHIRAGRVKPIAVLGDTRSRFLPETPSLGELGYDFPYTGGWFGLAAPQGTPDAIMQRIAAAIHAIGQDLEFRARFLEPAAYEGVGNTPAEFASFVERERVRGAEIVRAAGLKTD